MYVFSDECLLYLQVDKIEGVEVDSRLIVGSEEGPHDSQSEVLAGQGRHIQSKS